MDYLKIQRMRITGVTPGTNGLTVSAELTAAPGVCPHCPGSPSGLAAHGTVSRVVKDVPARGRTVRIVITRRRYRCPACGSIFREYTATPGGAAGAATPRVLGLGVVYVRLKKVLVMTDAGRRRVTLLTRSTDGVSIARALLRLPEHWRVEVIIFDTSALLRYVVRRVLPRAEVVVDRFHLRRMANYDSGRGRRHIQ